MKIPPAGRRLLTASLCFWLAASLALSGSSWAMGPFEKNHPLVQRGVTAYDQQKYDEALQAFEAAKKELPQNSAVEFNRGNALFKLGRLDDAKEAYQHVIDNDRGQLAEKDYYNLGNAWAELGNDKEAIAAYRKALTLDPNDSLARHNLEVVLRKIKPPPQQQKPDGGQDAGSDGGSDGGHPDGGQDGGNKPDGGSDGGADGGSDGGSDGGNQQGGDAGSDGGSDAGSKGGKGKKDGDAGQPEPEEHPQSPDAGGQSGADAGMEEAEKASLDGGSDLSKKDAERLLDSMRAAEKNMQLWRFQQKKKSRKPNEKDW